MEDFLELCKGYSEKMHLGLFNPNEVCLAYKCHLCQCHWCFPGSPVGVLVGPPHTVALCSQGSSSCSSPVSLSWQVLCLAPWHKDGSGRGCCLCAQCLSQPSLSPPLEQEFRLAPMPDENQGVLPIQDVLKGNLISLTCSSRFYISVTFRLLPFPLQF